MNSQNDGARRVVLRPGFRDTYAKSPQSTEFVLLGARSTATRTNYAAPQSASGRVQR